MDFKLPDIGEGVTEGEVTRWLVKVGDKLEVDQPMVEVMTDKATVELPSPVQGIVEALLAEEGTTVEVGKTIISIAENKDLDTNTQEMPLPDSKGTPAPPPLPQETPVLVTSSELKEEESQPPPLQSENSDKEPIAFEILATPATRKLARKLDIDLSTVRGTGPNGRITKADLQSSYESQQAPPSEPPPEVVPSAPTKTRAQLVQIQPGETQRVPLRGVRRKISEAMSRSKRTAAHFTFVEEVDMTEIVKLKEAAKEEAERLRTKLTYLPFILKALIPALKEFPYLNASLDDEKQEVILKGDYNIGVATDTKNGLVVPVVKGADRKTTWELADEIASLSEDARTGEIALEDLRGSTFTVTNSGSIGGVLATPIINFPEIGILGINAIRKRPVVINDEIKVRHMMFLSLSVDHRVVDGADAARFMNRLVYFLSDPKRFVLA